METSKFPFYNHRKKNFPYYSTKKWQSHGHEDFIIFKECYSVEYWRVKFKINTYLGRYNSIITIIILLL